MVAKRSIVHFSCMSRWVIMTLILVLTTQISSSLRLMPQSAAPAASLPYYYQELQDEGMIGSHSEVQPEDVVADYGIWDPTPYSGGGGYAPVPHARRSTYASYPN
ncbi:hypothetical protein Tsubulata_039842 [Turnera subulata]|uniref:Uncharacterized protein n=1 Tax=Turnera subulata TaxID=218843 RepID=A0A9Q0G5U8_9ROSI|nr:hypothetical protein Tsubulata_039842 [Turnera subulata]